MPYKYISLLVRRDPNYDECRPWFHLGVGTKNEILLNSEFLDKTRPQSYFLVPLSPGGTSPTFSRHERLETNANNAHISGTLLPSWWKKKPSKFLALLSCFPIIPSNSRGTTGAFWLLRSHERYRLLCFLVSDLESDIPRMDWVMQRHGGTGSCVAGPAVFPSEQIQRNPVQH